MGPRDSSKVLSSPHVKLMRRREISKGYPEEMISEGGGKGRQERALMLGEHRVKPCLHCHIPTHWLCAKKSKDLEGTET